MIPLAHIQQWATHAPWPDLRQVEQDLIISRALCDLFNSPKLNHSLTEDISPLLPAGVTFDDDAAIEAFGKVWGELIVRIPGEPWKSSKSVIEAIRAAKIPKLLDGVYE